MGEEILSEEYLIDVIDTYKEATKCNSCFENKELKMVRGKVRKAQPRWVGKNYFSSDLRICLMLINPGNVGSGKGQAKIETSRKFDNTIKQFGKGTESWRDVMSFIHKDMENWGEGRYWHFYFEKMKLNIDEVAMMNMMLCSATEVNKNKNYYTSSSLRNCYALHTKKLITELDPDFLILSGTNVTSALKPFRQDLEKILPKCEFIDTFHYRPQLKADWPKADKAAENVGNYLKEFLI